MVLLITRRYPGTGDKESKLLHMHEKLASTPHRRSVCLRRMDNGRTDGRKLMAISLRRKSALGLAMTLTFNL